MSEPLLYGARAVAAVELSLLALILVVVAVRGVGSGRSSRQARSSIRGVRGRRPMARRVTDPFTARRQTNPGTQRDDNRGDHSNRLPKQLRSAWLVGARLTWRGSRACA
jgi:hypothetical protein